MHPRSIIFFLGINFILTSVAYSDEPRAQDYKSLCAENTNSHKTYSSFFCNSHLDLDLRLFDFTRDREEIVDSKASALGGILRLSSGQWRNLFRTSAAWYTSRGIDTPKDKPGAQLLRPIQKDINIFGEAWVELQFSQNTSLKSGRQTLNLPFLNKHYARMLPASYQAHILTSQLQPHTELQLGYVEKVKMRASDKFVHMSERAGVPNSKKGLSLLRLQHHFNEDTQILMTNTHTADIFNTSYAEFKTLWHFADDRPVNISLQGTYQTSVGEEHRESFDTHHIGFKLTTPVRNLNLLLAGTHTSDERKILRPYGGSPAYLSIINQDFDRAGEDAIMFGVAYDFAHANIPGLSAYANLAYGRTPDHGRVILPDQTEFDVTIDYKLQVQKKNQLWFRLRFASLNQTGIYAQDATDLHLIVTYSTSLF